jgi:hypothetical protein
MGKVIAKLMFSKYAVGDVEWVNISVQGEMTSSCESRLEFLIS